MITDFWIKQGDTLEALVATLQYKDGSPLTRSLVAATGKFHMRDLNGTVLVNRVCSLNDSTKQATYQWLAGDTVEASMASTPHQAEIEVTYADGNVETFPNDSNINIHVTPQIA